MMTMVKKCKDAWVIRRNSISYLPECMDRVAGFLCAVLYVVLWKTEHQLYHASHDAGGRLDRTGSGDSGISTVLDLWAWTFI